MKSAKRHSFSGSLNALPNAGLPEWHAEKIQAAVQTFHDWGGVLDFACHAYAEAAYADEQQRYEVHRQAAKDTLYAVVAARNAAWARYAVAQNLPRDRLPECRVYPEPPKLSGTRLPAASFWGRRLRLEQGNPRVLVCGGAGKNGSRCFWHDTPEPVDDTAAAPLLDADDSFAYAFFEPPHTFASGKTPAQQGRFFLDFCALLFGRRLDQVEVYGWNTDCSDYFADGREWWGTYFWTVYSREYETYVGITGSATD